ncbi:MAG: hypothetical protein A2315_08350 [Ignavibacteria bacterium RIFOXYB2_FULL_35_12]|nr:MAG: hypothetical protein A2058_08490 [Ignavibacteria bacterium GWA2_36_19]OGU53736.1 MAG: hypothetical protein A2006_13025 [Ignavibacteria bacterium GWC2_35_8]OGU59888.1 MAG: hypothetical protein A2X60_14345 [Ignavibacteria bacterium GWF2_35_20]OGU82181.1 MAG: hypothetical protein A2254_01935 [Ignavibacteria bacterium RIFOXYA2_FULL_35_9]OGU89293.1 MAG: hypothetical protein A2492_10475 [Ignavibacteria bacterium RIFOXYC12_FULL_35_11]OGU90709.1 MAG: hypothetical protein A3K31_15095 [Ignavibac
MPLKKPKTVPKIAKARKVTIDKLKEAVPNKRESEIEYNCKIAFKFNPVKKVQQYLFALETEKLFSSMKYGITTESKKDKKVIDISILGLTPSQAYLIEPGPAKSEVFFEDLYGEYTVNIIKKDGSINSAIVDFNLFKKDIKLLKEFLPPKKNNRKFCTFSVDQRNFAFE